MARYWIPAAIGLVGIAGLLVASLFTDSSGPDSPTGLNVTIATFAGILLGGVLGALADGLSCRQGRLPLTWAVLALGAVYVGVTMPLFDYLQIEN